MNDQEVIAFGCIARALILSLGMMSENLQRIQRGESIAYPYDAFDTVIVAESASWNQVMERVRRG
jgi:hypothetical protein